MESPSSKRSVWPLLAAAALATALLALACQPPEQAQTPPPAAALPAYSTQAATLFDDSMAPDIFGAVPDTDAASDPVLASRTQQAEAVLPVRVQTVTSDSGGDNPDYTLVLQPAGPALAGHAGPEEISIEVEPTSPAYPFVHSADSTLVGKEFILFFRHYNQEGRTTLHWRAEADTPALRAAVEQARLVGGFGN